MLVAETRIQSSDPAEQDGRRSQDGNPEEQLFNGLLSNVARSTLLRAGFSAFTPSKETNVRQFLNHFTELWSRVGDGSVPNVDQVLREMDRRETLLYRLWMMALRDDAAGDDLPLVAQAPVRATANPLVFKSSLLKRPLVVMAEGFWQFIFGSALGLLVWADTDHEGQGLALATASAREWLFNQPALGPEGMAAAEASTLDLDTTTLAVGLADSAFTWAFLHEMGHVMLGHLPTAQLVRKMSPDGTGTAGVSAYQPAQELEADRFGYQRLLGLMPLSDQIRRDLNFGPQIDHAPLIAFELLDWAIRLGGRFDLLDSATHPPPLERAANLRIHHASQLSEEGRSFYAYWHERFHAFRTETLKGPTL